MNQLTDTLHLLLCQKQHVRDMMKIVDRSKTSCYYYLEEQIEGGDAMPSHFEWEEVKKNFKATLGFKSDMEALDFLRACINISQEINRVVGRDSHKEAFLKSILL